MAYDEELADRVRELVDAEPALGERKMFGGLAFMIGGNLAVGASSQGGLIVRADRERVDELVATTDAEHMEMRGRPMGGWLHIDADHVRTKRQLARWVENRRRLRRQLPPKT